MSRCGQEARPDVPECSGDPSGCSAVVGRPSRICGNGREALPDVREWYGGPPVCWIGRDALLNMQEWPGGPPKCPGVVGSPPRMSGRPSRFFGSHRETIPVVRGGREAHPDVRGPYRMTGSVRLALPDVQQLSRGPPGSPGVVGRTTRMSGSGPESLPVVWEWSGGSPGCPGVVGRSS